MGRTCFGRQPGPNLLKPLAYGEGSVSAEFDGTLTTRPDGPIFLFDPTTYRPDRVRDSPVLRALMAHFGQGAREIAMVGIDGEHCVVDLSSRRQGQDAVHALGSRILQICQELARPSVG